MVREVLPSVNGKTNETADVLCYSAGGGIESRLTGLKMKPSLCPTVLKCSFLFLLMLHATLNTGLPRPL